MEAYTDFADVYDTFMDETPYEEWADYLQEILMENEIRDGIILDLGFEREFSWVTPSFLA